MASPLQTKLIVFTDLDGSLLDHESYSHAPADSTLHLLEEMNVPVILTTSKTRAEVLSLRDELENQHPFIIENGAAVFIPQSYFPEQPKGCSARDGYWVKEFSKSREVWLELLAAAKREFRHSFSHFALMKEEVIASLTGLKPEQAELANQREYGEPVSWLGADAQRLKFIAWLEQRGANVLQGGRFLHISGSCDKGQALTWLANEYQNQWQLEDLKTLAIGDSHNDIAMLDSASLALIIRSPAHTPPKLKRQRGYFVSDEYGPRGWAEGVNKILDRSENT